MAFDADTMETDARETLETVTLIFGERAPALWRTEGVVTAVAVMERSTGIIQQARETAEQAVPKLSAARILRTPGNRRRVTRRESLAPRRKRSRHGGY